MNRSNLPTSTFRDYVVVLRPSLPESQLNVTESGDGQ